MSGSGGALLFRLPSKLDERTGVVVSPPISASANGPFAGGLGPVAARRRTFGDARMTAALRDRLTRRGHIRATGDDSFRLGARAEAPRGRTEGRPALT